MNLIYLINITSIVAVNRLELFKKHHREINGRSSYGSSNEVSHGSFYGSTDRTLASRSLPKSNKLARVVKKACSIKTCTQCRQLKTKRCQRIFELPDCCNKKRLGFFLF